MRSMRPGPPPAPGEAASPALALVNTRYHGLRGEVDLLARAGDPGALLVELGLAPHDAAADPTLPPRLRALRDDVREILRARVDRRLPQAEAVAAVNAAAAAAPRAAELRWSDDGPPARASAAVSGTSADRICGEIAEDAIDLVAGGRGESLLVCAAPRCVRLLVKDHPRRQWCSPACGERVRSSRYYHRHRPHDEPSA